MTEIVINKERYECPPAVAAYIKQLEEENACLEESFQRATGEIAADPLPRETVDRKRFNDAANEIGESIVGGIDKLAIAVFVNELEERLFGGAGKWKL